MKKDNIIVSWLANGFGVIFTAVQNNEILQYISLALTIIATGTSIAFTIWKWYVKAKEDGKITVEEIEDLQNKINNNLKNKEDHK